MKSDNKSVLFNTITRWDAFLQYDRECRCGQPMKIRRFLLTKIYHLVFFRYEIFRLQQIGKNPEIHH